MQITLNQDEIHEAVESYVRNQITIAANQTIEIDFTAGRGPNGLSATLQISPARRLPMSGQDMSTNVYRTGETGGNAAADDQTAAMAPRGAVRAISETTAADEPVAVSPAQPETKPDDEPVYEGPGADTETLDAGEDTSADEEPAIKQSPFKKLKKSDGDEEAPAEAESSSKPVRSIFSKAG